MLAARGGAGADEDGAAGASGEGGAAALQQTAADAAALAGGAPRRPAPAGRGAPAGPHRVLWQGSAARAPCLYCTRKTVCLSLKELELCSAVSQRRAAPGAAGADAAGEFPPGWRTTPGLRGNTTAAAAAGPAAGVLSHVAGSGCAELQAWGTMTGGAVQSSLFMTGLGPALLMCQTRAVPCRRHSSSAGRLHGLVLCERARFAGRGTMGAERRLGRQGRRRALRRPPTPGPRGPGRARRRGRPTQARRPAAGTRAAWAAQRPRCWRASRRWAPATARCSGASLPRRTTGRPWRARRTSWRAPRSPRVWRRCSGRATRRMEGADQRCCASWPRPTTLERGCAAELTRHRAWRRTCLGDTSQQEASFARQGSAAQARLPCCGVTTKTSVDSDKTLHVVCL